MPLQSKVVNVELGLDEPQDESALRRAVARRLGMDAASLPLVVLRQRSLDCRGRKIRFHLLFDVIAGNHSDTVSFGIANPAELAAPHPVEVSAPARVIIVGDGPCGLFCAYQLARLGI